MLRLLSSLSLFCLILLTCNGIADSIKGLVKDRIDDAIETLRKQDVQTRNEYAESYQAKMHHDSDPALQKMLLRLDSTIAEGAHYMDSISDEMKFLEDHDPNNMEYAKTLFLYKGIGDTLYTILSRVNNLARTIAAETGHVSMVDSLRLIVLNQPRMDAWKEQDFSILDPFTAMVLVYDSVPREM
jgi:hypothetical protein